MPSYGYDGPIAANEWAAMQAGLAVDYSAETAAACKATANSSGVQIAAGKISGWGILDVIPSAVQVNLTAPGSGQAWWMVVARRTWGASMTTTFVAISAGTSRPSTLPTRQVTPGVQDDQPIALVGWTAGQSQPGSVIDLRAVGLAGQQLIFDAQAMQYLTRAGRRLRLGADDWTCVMGGSGSLTWVSGASTAGVRAAARAVRSGGGPTVPADTWVQVTFPTITSGTMINTAGSITIPETRDWLITFTFPWRYYGSNYDRFLALFKGTATPSSSAVPIAAKRERQAGRWWEQISYLGPLTAGDIVTAWVRSDVSSAGGSTDAYAPPISLAIVAQ